MTSNGPFKHLLAPVATYTVSTMTLNSSLVPPTGTVPVPVPVRYRWGKVMLSVTPPFTAPDRAFNIVATTFTHCRHFGTSVRDLSMFFCRHSLEEVWLAAAGSFGQPTQHGRASI